MLAGGFEETDASGDQAVTAGRAGLRPEGLRHAVRFGPAGALVLTFAAPGRPDGGPAIATPAWSPTLARPHLRRLVPLLLEGGDDGDDAVCDLLALCAAPARDTTVDPWLAAVRDRLIAEPAETRLADLAHRAGRHRVHLGRAFLAAYGETPSVFRRRAMLDRALCLTAQGLSAAQAAVDAGFADQSHFSRACRDLYGLPPGRLTAWAA